MISVSPLAYNLRWSYIAYFFFLLRCGRSTPCYQLMVGGFCAFSVIQFCATAFAYYAQATAAEEIFGHTLQSLRGIKYLYKSVTILQFTSLSLFWDLSTHLDNVYCRYNVFQIGFIALAGLTFVYYAAFVSELFDYSSFFWYTEPKAMFGCLARTIPVGSLWKHNTLELLVTLLDDNLYLLPRPMFGRDRMHI